jgi:hypothetical protein
MGRSLLTGSLPQNFDASDIKDSFRFLAFKQRTGEILSHGSMAVFALMQADLLEPEEAIEILDAGVAGKNLWQNQTALPKARLVVDMLAAPWSAVAQQPHSQTSA